MKRIFGNSMDDIDNNDDDQKNPMLGGDNSTSPEEKEMDEILSPPDDGTQKPIEGDQVEVIAEEHEYYGQTAEVIEPWEETVLIIFPDGVRMKLPYSFVRKISSMKKKAINKGDTVRVTNSDSYHYGNTGKVTYVESDSFGSSFFKVEFPNGEIESFGEEEIKKVSSKKTSDIPRYQGMGSATVSDPSSPYHSQTGEIVELAPGGPFVLEFPDGTRESFREDQLDGWIDKTSSKKTAQDQLEFQIGEDVVVNDPDREIYEKNGIVVDIYGIEYGDPEIVVELDEGGPRVTVSPEYITKLGVSKKTAQTDKFWEGDRVKVVYDQSPYYGKEGEIATGSEVSNWIVKFPDGSEETFIGADLEKVSSKKTAQELYHEGETVKVLKLSSRYYTQTGEIVFISSEGSLTLEFPNGERETLYDYEIEKLATGVTREKKTAQKDLELLKEKAREYPSAQEFFDAFPININGEDYCILDVPNPDDPQSPARFEQVMKFWEESSGGSPEIIGKKKTAHQIDTQQLNDILQRDFDFTLPELSRRMKDLMQFVEEQMTQSEETMDNAVGMWVDKTDSGNLVVGVLKVAFEEGESATVTKPDSPYFGQEGKVIRIEPTSGLVILEFPNDVQVGYFEEDIARVD